MRSFQVVGFVTASIGNSITRANCYNMGLPHAPKNKLTKTSLGGDYVNEKSNLEG